MGDLNFDIIHIMRIHKKLSKGISNTPEADKN